MTLEPSYESSPTFSLTEAAMRLDVDEPTLREWLATFKWERHYDGAGHLFLTQRDLAFLRVVKSLKDVDRSCESIVRIITQEELAGAEPEEAAEADEPAAEVPCNGAEQIASLKAELKELHAKPAKKPFWRFW